MKLRELLFKATAGDHTKLLYRRKWGEEYMISLDRKFRGDDVPYETRLFVVKPGVSVMIPWVATTEDIVADDWELSG